MPGSSAASRFSIWQIAVTSLLLLPLGILFLPEIPLGLVSNTSAVPSLPPAPTSVRDSQPSISLSNNSALKVVGPQAKSSPPVQTSSTITTVSSKVPQVAASPNAPPVFEVTRHVVAQTALVIWLVIALALLLRTLLEHLRVALAAHSFDCEIGPVRTERSDWLPDSVDLAYCDRQNVPITIGIWRRRIILPAVADKWSTDQLRMVLKHELAHVLRRDVLWQLVTSIATNIFWFQPLAWWANHQLKLERERACDDQVIAGGEQAADYATVLVQLAATFSGRKTIPTGALSMAKKPIERRLATILSPSTTRTSTNRWVGSLATTIALLVVAGVCSIRPFAPLAIATPVADPLLSSFQDSETGDLDFPSRLTGLVVDEDDKPVVGAELHLTATPRPKSEAYHFGFTQATVHLHVVKTDGEGKYLVNISELENGQDIWSIHGKAIAENRPSAPFAKTIGKGTKPTLTIRTIRFQPGKTIVGRVIPPASSANLKLKNPVISVRPIGMLPSHKWVGETVECDSDGRFSVMVARDVRVSIQATADNFAGTGLEVQPQVRDLKDIQLQAGKKLKGKLLDRDGRPVAGVLVYSDTDYDDNRFFWNGSNEAYEYRQHFSRHCKTNINGEFELEPQIGKVRVSLRSSIYEFQSHKNVTSDRVPPVVIPLQIDLAEFGLAQAFNLKEAKTVRASGAIHWPDGSPAIGLEAKVNLMIGSSGIDIFSTMTDKNGNYTVLIPENIQSSISVCGATDSSNQWLFAKASTKSEKAFQQSTQILGLIPLTDDVTGLDWKLSKRDARRVSSTTPDERELERLLATRESDGAKGRLRIAGAANDQEKQELTERYEQSSKVNYANLIAFEEKHRGEFMGAVALANYIDPKEPEQLDEFTANYLSSPNADVVLGDIYYQGNLAHTRKMLNTFAENSPHATIQATALFHEAAVIAEALMQKEYFKNPKWHPTWPEPKTQEEEIQLAKYKQLLTELISCNSEQLLSDFDSILTTLKTKYAEHGSTVVNWGGERLKERRTKGVVQTYADQLQEFRFQLENLKSGQPLPRLTGRDVHGVDFDSERLKGKTVLLFFTSNQYTDRANFKQLRELKKRYAGRPFEIVSVMVDLKPEEAKAAVDTGKITWPTLYDEGQQLMKEWQFNPCSDRLLIDHQGIIQRRAMYGTELDETIELLVRNAEGK